MDYLFSLIFQKMIYITISTKTLIKQVEFLKRLIHLFVFIYCMYICVNLHEFMCTTHVLYLWGPEVCTRFPGLA